MSHLGIPCTCSYVFVCTRVFHPEGKHGGSMETERMEREESGRSRVTVLNLLDGIHLGSLLFQPETGESFSIFGRLSAFD